MRPKVLVTQRLVSETRYPETRDALDIRWADYFSKLGVLPILLPSHGSAKAYFAEFSFVGLFLTGGNDVGQVSDDALSKKRDSVESQALSLALKKKIPVIGICRGMQFLTAYFKGGLAKLEAHSGTRHALLFSDTGRFAKEQKKHSDVNSYHNFGVVQAPKGFVPTARAPDGTIEAFEQPSKKIWGQMWHPEREVPFQTVDLRIFKRILFQKFK